MKIAAMVLEQFNQPLALREIEIPALEADQLLIKIDAAGVCGSDVHMWRGEDPRTPLPIILGHEGIGTIVDMNGKKQTVNNEPLQVGDRILWHRGVSCGKCYFCAVLHDPALCQDRKVYGINRSSSEQPFLNGCYSEYIILTAGTDIFKIDQQIDPALLVAASCSGSTVAHGYDIVPPRFGDTVLIQGPGPLGLFAIAFAKKMGASKVIVIGGSENRLNVCRSFGADIVLNRKETTAEERRETVLSATHGRGADLIVEATGDPSAVHEGLKLARSGGTYLSVGFSQPPGTCGVDFFLEVVRKNLRIQGVWVSSTRHTEQAIKLVCGQPELFASLVTHRYKLTEASQALTAMHQREALKAVLLPGS